MTLLKPKALTKGATIGVMAPGSPVKPERFQAGIAELKKRGFAVKCPLDPSKFYGRYDHGFTNGSAHERASALAGLFLDKDVQCIIAARGGYGALDLLPYLDLNLIRSCPKPFVGYSDVTGLLVSIFGKTRIPTIHGPTVSKEFAESGSSADAAASVELLLSLLTKAKPELVANCHVIREGSGSGEIIAGNLMMLTTLLGTPWDISYDGAVLIVEEVDEAPYRVHRMLTQLKLAGKLAKLNALVFGNFHQCRAEHGPTINELVEALPNGILSGTKYPIVSGLEFGHGGINTALPLGCQAKVASDKFELLESPVM